MSICLSVSQRVHVSILLRDDVWSGENEREREREREGLTVMLVIIWDERASRIRTVASSVVIQFTQMTNREEDEGREKEREGNGRRRVFHGDVIRCQRWNMTMLRRVKFGSQLYWPKRMIRWNGQQCASLWNWNWNWIFSPTAVHALPLSATLLTE